MEPMQNSELIIDLYERHAHAFDEDRGRSLFEKAWLDRFLGLTPSRATILDLGCGMGEPIAEYLLAQGLRVVGVDSSPSMIRLCEERFPQSEWIVSDMRRLELARRFDGLLAWDSFFHLTAEDQRGMFGRFAAHAKPGAPLMFTSGPSAGEAIGCRWGEPLYHASMDPEEYITLLEAHDFEVCDHQANDPECGGHTVWLVRFRGSGLV
jgi:2-polyprenyl-3-methyl-5-hydroxy-6-metoxy-1,4-benzoquinol methylase